MSAPVQPQQYPANLHHTLPLHPSGERKQKRAGVANFTMSDCYEKLKQLVPTIPKNKKITRVEILQHVIDYIQDLQTALEERNIDVKVMGNLNELSGMMSETMALPAPAASNRAPFTTIVPQQQYSQMTCPPPTPLGVRNHNARQQPPCYPQQTSLYQQSFSEFHHRPQVNSALAIVIKSHLIMSF